MNQTNNNNLSNLSSKTSTSWREKAAFRKQNKWLEYSSQIARRIIAIIRNRQELNQVKLAEMVGVSAQQISKIVKGQENLTLETIYKLSQALGEELITFPEYEYSQKLITTSSKSLSSYSMQIVRNDQADSFYDDFNELLERASRQTKGVVLPNFTQMHTSKAN
jgi:transcriptional regulator with XRE-family HTH domain